MSDAPERGAELAQLLFPAVTETPADIYARYAPRDLPEGAIVTRFGPSPTGFIHIGSVYISLVGRMLTQQSGGSFLLRIEDTDQERKLEGGIAEIVSNLLAFDLTPDEGFYQLDPLAERGAYAPYQQSLRKPIYAVFAKQMVAEGLAYPSFQGSEELNALRQQQERAKIKPGYYGPWAQDRNLSFADIETNLAAGKPFVIRYRAKYPTDERIRVPDAIRGTLELPANDQDMVILKSDGLPTYHLAHAVDDSTMRVNLILRADEWLATLPLHVQLFEAIHFPLPLYAHIAPIGKIDGSSKRKLSKRKDPEAAVSYYYQQGYPRQAILEYLLNIANSAFEDWRTANPGVPFTDFPLKLENMSPSVALFDLAKLDSISKDIIAGYTAAEVYAAMIDWARQYDPSLVEVLSADPDYSQRVFNIEREGDAPRKDLAHWSDFHTTYGFFFDTLYDQATAAGYQLPQIDAADIRKIAEYISATVDNLPDKDTWLQAMREFSESLGFAPNQKVYKKSPGEFRGQFNDVMMVYRVGLTNQRFTPDLYEMIHIMGSARVRRRMAQVVASLG